MHLHESGHDIAIWVPILAGLVVSLLATPAGVSGAFLLLPFQVSILGIASPSATATNLLYNVVATPGGIMGYRAKGQLDGKLARLVTYGTLPGVFVGAIVRVKLLANPAVFKLFVGTVLVALALKLFADLYVLRKRIGSDRKPPSAMGRPGGIVAVSLVVGLIGGIYGIGGGSIIAPYLVTVAGLSVYGVAGAALLATFITSAAGVVLFEALGWFTHSQTVGPNWALGLLFGIGGLAGSSIGARVQHRLPEAGVRAVLGTLVAALGISYVAQGTASLRK